MADKPNALVAADKKPLKLIVGLGNPGREHADTPHNAGFWLVDEITRKYGGEMKTEAKFHGEAGKALIGGRQCRLLKPMTFMNKSGAAVAAIARFYKIAADEVAVAHDDLDFAPGAARLKFGGGHGGHNGLRDIIPVIGGGFCRIRLGVGHPGDRDRVLGYLLGVAGAEVRAGVDRAVAGVMEVIEYLVGGDMDRATRQLHSKPAYYDQGDQGAKNES